MRRDVENLMSLKQFIDTLDKMAPFIAKRDIEGIAQIYESIMGENPLVGESPTPPKAKKLSKENGAKLKGPKKTVKVPKLSVPKVSKGSKVKSNVGRGAGPVGFKNYQPLIIQGDVDPRLQKACVKASKKDRKEYRKVNKPRMMNCTNCKQEFNFNKSYPSGKVDTATNIYLCTKCQGSR